MTPSVRTLKGSKIKSFKGSSSLCPRGSNSRGFSIREHMAKIADLIGLEQQPSPTWARHSFATNLNNSGHVPYKYISDSMGHSGNGDITSNYIGAYPLEKMLEYNSYLLKESKPADNKSTLLEILKGLSEEERAELMKEVSK